MVCFRQYFCKQGWANANTFFVVFLFLKIGKITLVTFFFCVCSCFPVIFRVLLGNDFHLNAFFGPDNSKLWQFYLPFVSSFLGGAGNGMFQKQEKMMKFQKYQISEVQKNMLNIDYTNLKMAQMARKKLMNTKPKSKRWRLFFPGPGTDPKTRPGSHLGGVSSLYWKKCQKLQNMANLKQSP